VPIHYLLNGISLILIYLFIASFKCNDSNEVVTSLCIRSYSCEIVTVLSLDRTFYNRIYF